MYAKAAENVINIMEQVPEARVDKKLLCLLYWMLYDNIDIPADVVKKIINQGTPPETILRYQRMYGDRHSCKIPA